MEIRNYIGFSRDHSASMRPIAVAAARDYNHNIEVIKNEAITNHQDTVVSVVQCGVGPYAKIVREIENRNVLVLKPMEETAKGYAADGHATPLFDSVVDLINVMKSAPDANDITVSFLVMVITDGEDNHSKISGSQMGKIIKDLQSTDRWSFVFRVPRGAARGLIANGIHPGNILEWDQTEKGVQAASTATATAMRSFYADRAAGKTSTKTFYSNLSEVTKEEIAAALTDISAEVSIWPVGQIEAGSQIREFVEKRLPNNAAMVPGTAFYQLTKTEKAVQDYKVIVVRNQKSSTVYSGAAARQLLGLPTVGDVRLKVGDHGDYDVFIQSTSVNRKLTEGSSLLYWPHASLNK